MKGGDDDTSWLYGHAAGIATGIALGVLDLVAAAAWYGCGRARPALDRRARQRFTGGRAVRSDLSGWGRAG